MKKLILIAIAMASAVVVAAENKKALTPEEVAAKRARGKEMFLKKTGGFIVRPGTQKGEVVYVNCQTRVPKAWIEESIAYFAKETKFKVSLKDGGTFDFKNPKIEGNASLYIIDDAAFPAILVAPENRWAFVNIAPIAKEQRPAFFQARVKKELTRGFAYLCGAANSQYPRALTRGIVDHADLDKNPDHALPVDVIHRFRTYMETLGVTPAQISTYRRACQEGWAPAPTNEAQKVIWEQIRNVPKNPMKIEFDPKKGR